MLRRALSCGVGLVLLMSPAGTSAQPARRGVDLGALDRAADPCTDFYQFACGGWLARNPIPGDQSMWGRFNELDDRNNAILQGILSKAATPSAARTPIEQKIGDFYATCMDEPAIEKLGLSPLDKDLARIDGMKSLRDLPGVIAALHTAGVPALFDVQAEQDFKDTTRVIAMIDQGGLGLPDRDYYVNDDTKSIELRDSYQKHVAAMLRLAGGRERASAQDSGAIAKFETALAQASLDVVTRRDPNALYHKMTVDELQALSPSFDWKAYFAALGTPPFSDLNVIAPDFVKQIEMLAKNTPLATWKTYLRWHTVRSQAAYLSSPFVKERFAFYGTTLTGAKEQRPREKRCASLVDDQLGDALGQKYVEATFGAEGKQRMLTMVEGLIRALDRDIRELPWMSEATRAQAISKLTAIRNKIGYPDTWRDYAALSIVRGDHLGNVQRAQAFETRRQLAKIGQPVDRLEWEMSPPTVNAYYHPLKNDINFPAGILQPPFFTREADEAINYGAIGAVIGHELTHGFDDQGRQFAADGTLKDWWTPEDGKEFERRADCFVQQYGDYAAVDELKLNGKLTLGENVADAGGLRIALMALQDLMRQMPGATLDGFTPEQRLFIGWGQMWCTNTRPELMRVLAQTDPHSPGKYRVNGVMVNTPEFARAFACQPTAPMVKAADKVCRVW